MAKTILIADDNPHVRKALCKLFQAEKDYDLCAEAENGKQAIELAQQCHPDLIILDLSMPVMSGLEAARELKKLLPTVPIILFTQYENTDSWLPHHPNVDRIVSKANGNLLMAHVRELAPCSLSGF